MPTFASSVFVPVFLSSFSCIKTKLVALPEGAGATQLDEVEQAAVQCLIRTFAVRLPGRNTRITLHPLRMLLYFANRRCQLFTETAAQQAAALKSPLKQKQKSVEKEELPSGNRGMDGVLLALQTLAQIRWDATGRIFLADGAKPHGAPSPFLRIRLPEITVAASQEQRARRSSMVAVADVMAHHQAAAKVFDFGTEVTTVEVVNQIADMLVVLIRHPHTPVKMMLPVAGGLRSLLNSTHHMIPRIFDMSLLSTAVCSAILRLSAAVEKGSAPPVLTTRPDKGQQGAEAAAPAEVLRMEKKLVLNDLCVIPPPPHRRSAVRVV
jgi:hypothetical protein